MVSMRGHDFPNVVFYVTENLCVNIISDLTISHLDVCPEN